MKEKNYSNYATFSLNKIDAPKKEKDAPKSTVNRSMSNSASKRVKK